MSKLDYLTIAVVVVGIIALSVLGYKIYQNNNAASDDYTAIDTPSDDLTSEDEYPSYQDDQYNDNTSSENDDYYNVDDNSSEKSAIQEDDEYTSSEDYTAEKDADLQPENNFTSSSSGNYMVISGSFDFRHNADNHAKRIRKLGYSNTTVENFWGKKGMKAAVLVDRFDNLTDARTLRDELKSQHSLESYIKKKQ